LLSVKLKLNFPLVSPLDQSTNGADAV